MKSNYYYDTEFLEGIQPKKFLGLFPIKTKPTIDLISIAIVSDDNRELYEISNEFNLKEAWNRFQIETQSGDARNIFPEGKKVYWIRENVLRPIFEELQKRYYDQADRLHSLAMTVRHVEFCYRDLKFLIKMYGKSNAQISGLIMRFVIDPKGELLNDCYACFLDEYYDALKKIEDIEPVFYGWYSAYDHVVFCWLFGKMLDLPESFPMYTRDMKQILDEKPALWNTDTHVNNGNLAAGCDPGVSTWKEHPNYPKQENEHDALSDARWNKKLHKFIIDHCK